MNDSGPPLVRYVAHCLAADDARFSRAEVARQAGLDQGNFQAWLAGRRGLPERCLPGLDKAIARGTVPRTGEPVPLYALAQIDADGDAALLRDADGRCAYLDGASASADLARWMAGLLRSAGLPDAEAIPLWPNALPAESLRIDAEMDSAGALPPGGDRDAALAISARFLTFAGAAIRAMIGAEPERAPVP